MILKCMRLNCKVGDLAIVIGDSKYAGRLVEILSIAPSTMFNLPDGYHHLGCPPGFWVIKILGTPAEALLVTGQTRTTIYGAGNDAKLRPLPGEVVDEEIETTLSTN